MRSRTYTLSTLKALVASTKGLRSPFVERAESVDIVNTSEAVAETALSASIRLYPPSRGTLFLPPSWLLLR